MVLFIFYTQREKEIFMSTFTHAGVSSLNGKMKVRFANDQMRVKILQKNDHKDIDIVQLKHPMTKDEAVAYLLSIDFDNGNSTVRAALEDAQGKRSTKEPKAAVPKVTKVKSKPTMAKIKAKVEAKKTATFAEAEAAVGPAPDMENQSY
jgi:hypothetical protein